MLNNKQFEIRDLRKKDKFVIDDEYLNGYAKLCGIYATGVYMSLCRHANRNQESWPSLETMAIELNISEMSVRRGIKNLKDYHIINIKRSGKKLNNCYYLIDKTEWLLKSDVSDRTLTNPQVIVPTEHSPVLPQNTHSATTEHSIVRKHIKETHLRIYNIAPIGADAYLQKILADPQRHIQVIGLWIKKTDLNPQNEDQFKSIIKRNLRPAMLLKGYSDADIIATIKALQHTEYLKKFTLETVCKYIDQVVASGVKNESQKIIRWEQVEHDGQIFMRAVCQE